MSSRGEDKTSHTVLELPHGRVLLVASTSLLRSYDDKTLKPLVAVPKKHKIKLILCEPNYGGGVLTSLPFAASKKNPH